MPRGEETQEGRETPQEGQEANQEAERTQEAVEQPQAVVERERPVVESEQIEKEVVEAVEAAEAAADGGRETEDGGEVSATPITLPDPPGDEVSATPITLPDPPKDQGDEISATPITLPDPPGDEISATPITLPDPPKDQGDEVSATPITLPDPPKDQGDEISATPITLPDPPSDQISAAQKTDDGETFESLDETSFKVESPSPDWDEDPPRPPQGTMEEGRSETEDGEESRVEDEEVILEENSFKPVPALSPDDVKLKDGVTETGEQKQTPTEPITERELPEDGQLQEGLEQRENLQDMMDKDLDSFIPGGGEVVGPDGKKAQGSKYGDGVSGLPGMDSGGKIDGSSEDPSGDQFAGKGRFKPGKGPGGGVDLAAGYSGPTPTTVDEAEVMELLAGKPTEKQVADKEKQLQEQALDGYDLQQSIVTGKTPDPPKPKKGKQKSTPDGDEGGSDVKAISQEEFDAVIDKVDGSQISTQDPDGQADVVPDRMTPEGAKRVKDAMDMAASSKGKKKKAGSEVVTDPDSEQEDKGGGKLGKEQEL